MSSKIVLRVSLASVFLTTILGCSGGCWSDISSFTLSNREILDLLTPLDTAEPTDTCADTATPVSCTESGLLDTGLTISGPLDSGHTALQDTADTGLVQDTADTGLGGDSGIPVDTGHSFPTAPETPETPETYSCTTICERYYRRNQNRNVTVNRCTLSPYDTVPASTKFTCDVYEPCTGGRLHQIIATETRATGTTAYGAWLSQMAHDEAASVHAFVALEQELRHHGAPASLRIRALEASRDEVRHAQMMAKHAALHGGQPLPPKTVPLVQRSLLEIAVENAVEGCVNETWLAMRAWVQARNATDLALRPVLLQVAQDETRHATLARDLDDWLRTQLTPDELQVLDQAMATAVRQVLARAGCAGTPRFTEAGLPTADEERRLLAGLASALWASGRFGVISTEL